MFGLPFFRERETDVEPYRVRRRILAKTPLVRNSSAEITNRATDVAVHKIFAFTDKNGKKGFFRVSDYIANVPQGDRAVLTLYVKMEK